MILMNFVNVLGLYLELQGMDNLLAATLVKYFPHLGRLVMVKVGPWIKKVENLVWFSLL